MGQSKPEFYRQLIEKHCSDNAIEQYVIHNCIDESPEGVRTFLDNELKFCQNQQIEFAMKNGYMVQYYKARHKAIEAYYKKVALPPQPINNETDTEKYTTKHYLLAYLFECNAKGESFPIGNKKELERIGNKRMGAGKGNRFYKVFNEVINKDLNAEKNLLEIGGEYWRKAVIELSKAPELVEKYLQSKQL